MKILFSLLFIIITSFFNLFADEIIILKDNEVNYDKNGLSIHIALVNDWEGTLKEWDKPSDQLPIIKTCYEFKRGDLAVPFIMYGTDALKDGKAKIIYSVKIIKPDGSLYSEHKNLKVIDGIPPQGFGRFQDVLGLKIENNDPLGKYSMEILVDDQFKKVKIKFRLIFKVIK
jgi:hypothetical protein